MVARIHLRHDEAHRRPMIRALPRRGAVGCVVVAAAALLFAGIVSGPHPPPRSIEPIARPIPTVAPLTVLTEQPWIGSSCPGSHSAAAIEASANVPLCDRIGLAINLRTRAVAATATINGQWFQLDSAAWSDPPVAGKHKVLAGFLRPAAFLTRGPFTTVTDPAGYRNRITIEHVHLVIEYGPGAEVQASLTEVGYGGWG